MAQAAYFTAQQIYAGWALFGIVLFGGLGTNLALTIMLRRLGRPYGYALAAFLFIAASLAIFFIWTFPANQATSNWTVVPENWIKLRAKWEYSHTVNAVVMFVALALATTSMARESATGKTRLPAGMISSHSASSRRADPIRPLSGRYRARFRSL